MLSDPKKRRTYDQFGEGGFQEQPRGPSFNFNDFFGGGKQQSSTFDGFNFHHVFHEFEDDTDYGFDPFNEGFGGGFDGGFFGNQFSPFDDMDSFDPNPSTYSHLQKFC